jgi:fumarate reductase subunit C
MAVASLHIQSFEFFMCSEKTYVFAVYIRNCIRYLVLVSVYNGKNETVQFMEHPALRI